MEQIQTTEREPTHVTGVGMKSTSRASTVRPDLVPEGAAHVVPFAFPTLFFCPFYLVVLKTKYFS